MALAVALLAVAGCSGASGSKAVLERTTIKVGIIPAVDFAPLELAIRRGLFTEEGLTVKTQVVSGGAEAIPKLSAGDLDISAANYVSTISAVASGTAKLKIIAEGYEAVPKGVGVLVLPDSPIRSAHDLHDKKIAVNTVGNVGTLTVRADLLPQGVLLDERQDFAEVAFPDMEGALTSHRVDAVWAVEPFVTRMQQSLGARMVLDTGSGVTANFPMGGYIADEKFVRENPNTVAAFQRAIVKAQALAADRKSVEQVLPLYTKIDPQAAALVRLGGYPTSLNPVRLQRVADLMLRLGYLQAPMDISTMVTSSFG